MPQPLRSEGFNLVFEVMGDEIRCRRFGTVTGHEGSTVVYTKNGLHPYLPALSPEALEDWTRAIYEAGWVPMSDKDGAP